MIIVAIVLAAGTRTSHAQGAWVGEAKSLDVDFSYQYVPSSAVVINPDLDIPDRPTKNHIMTLGVSYTPIDHLVIEADLPLALLKYTGEATHTPAGKWDDGKTHTTLTDLRVGGRYQILDEPYVAISPYLAVSIPVMDYEVIGFATGGRHLKQIHFGVSLGRTLDPVVPNLYITAGYEMSKAERFDKTENTKGIGQLRSDLETQIGYLLLDGKLDLNVAASWRIQHGGIDFEKFAMYPVDLQINHDPILNEEFIFAGGGVGYAITDKLAVAAAVRFFIQGYNTRDQTLFGLDFSYSVF